MKDKVSFRSCRRKFGGSKKAREVMEGNGYELIGNYYVKKEKPLEKEEPVEVASCRVSDGKPVLVTSYLFGSQACPRIMKSLEAHAESLGAEIVVIAHKYTNPTNLQGCLREEEGYDYVDPLVRPYLSWQRQEIHGHQILGDVQVNCNNLNPLPRIKKFTTGHSIIGHPMQSLHVKPVPSGMPHVLWSTGTVSLIDPASNLTAQQAQFHYKFGWIVLDVDGTSRNVHTRKNGDFTDKDLVFSEGQIVDKPSTLAVVWGDVHIEAVDHQALKWAIDLTREFKTPLLVLHDYFDSSAVNPHSQPYDRPIADLWESVCDAKSWLDNIERETKVSLLHLVESNHNDMLSRYFKTTPIEKMSKRDVSILKEWLAAGMSPEGIFADSPSRVVTNENSPLVGGNHLGLHGDKGINGAKGSLLSFFNTNVKAAIGHSHTPGMLGGASQLGCLCRLKMGYNDKGLSSWCHSILRLDIFEKHQHFIKFF